MDLPAETKNIGKWLKEGRRMLHLTQAQMAESLGVSQSTYSRWERENYAPPRSVLLEFGRLVAGKYAQAEEHQEGLHKDMQKSTFEVNTSINLVFIYTVLLDISSRLDLVLKKRKMSKEYAVPDPDISGLVDYYYQRYEAEKGVAPSKHKVTDMAVMKQAKCAGDYSTELMRQLIYTFLHYKGRTRCRMQDFAAAIDNVYLFLKDKSEGKR
jgi:DNA-binding XRE family transcriptional regulator